MDIFEDEIGSNKLENHNLDTPIKDISTQDRVSEIIGASPKRVYKKELINLKQLSREVRFFMDPKTRILTKISNNLISVLGYNPDEIEKLDDLILIQDRRRVFETIEENISPEAKKTSFVLEYRMHKKDGRSIIVEQKTIAKYDENGVVTELYGYLTDITEEKRLIYTDDETGLYNKKKLKEDIEKNTIPKILSIFKLHGFGELNSIYTYDMGNEIRDTLIQKFKELSWEYDFSLYTFGELKFAMMMNHIHSDEEAEERIEVIYKQMKKTLNGYPIHISMGYVFSDELSINKASIALEEIKKQPGVQKYTTELDTKNHNEAESREKWRSRIEHQIENFYPFYQKIKSNNPGVKDKYEALVRYIDEKVEVIAPFYFLKTAKDAGLMQKLTIRMIDQILIDLQDNDKNVSINFTTESLTSHPFIEDFIKKIEDNGIDFSRITIEILEDMSDDAETVKAILKTCALLKQKGIKIAIDDYGTGFSNIERILTINPDIIKIDGSLIRGIEKEDEDGKKKFKIVSMLINNFQNETTEIAFEFVENKEIQIIAQSLGSNYSQGYYYGKPTRTFE